MSGVDLAFAFLTGVVMGIALDRWVLPPLVDLWITRLRRHVGSGDPLPAVVPVHEEARDPVGFSYIRSKGKHHSVMRTTVPATRATRKRTRAKR